MNSTVAGAGISATVTVSGPVSFTEGVDKVGSFGVYSHYLPNGTYTVTVAAADGSSLGTRTVTIDIIQRLSPDVRLFHRFPAGASHPGTRGRR